MRITQNQMINLRLATPSDLEDIRIIALATWPVTYGTILSREQMDYMLNLFYSPSSLSRQMNENGHTFILAQPPGKASVGFASFAPHKDDSTIFHLHKFYLLPEWQKKGIGQALMTRVTEMVLAAGGKTLQLNVNRHNPAYHIYLHLGFSVLREEDIDIGQGYYMNDYVMSRKL